MKTILSAAQGLGAPVNGASIRSPTGALVAVGDDLVGAMTKGILDADPTIRVMHADGIGSALAVAGDHQDLRLAILGLDALEQTWLDQILKLCCQRRGLAIALVCETLQAGTAIQLVAAGIRGILPRAMARRPLSAALTMILAGEAYAPPGMLIPNWLQTENDAACSGRALSRRESEVAWLLAQGRTNKDIARRLGVSEVTVKVHMTSILRKLGARNRTQATVMLLADRGDAASILEGGL